MRSPDQQWLSREESSESAGKTALMVALVLFGAGMRLVPHEWNVAPLGAIALFAGAHFRNRLWAVLTPLAALLLSDLIMHVTWIHNRPGFYAGMEFTYLGFVAVACIGMLLRGGQERVSVRVAAIAAATIAGSAAFFLISNFGAWLTLYPRTWQGLLECYVKAIPFYRSTLLGDVIYVPLLFGTFALAVRFVPGWSMAKQARQSR